jgi:hypothetical protein
MSRVNVSHRSLFPGERLNFLGQNVGFLSLLSQKLSLTILTNSSSLSNETALRSLGWTALAGGKYIAAMATPRKLSQRNGITRAKLDKE